MAESTDQQRATYPLPTYNYRVDVGGVTMGFSKVSGLVVDRSTVTYRHGLSFREGIEIRQIAPETFGTLTLERGLVIGFEQLHEWLVEGDIRPLDIHLCDAEGKPVVTWQVRKAVPVRLQGPEIDGSTGGVALERLELEASTVSVSHPGAA